jgi:lysophospholipase L1-like esterase
MKDYAAEKEIQIIDFSKAFYDQQGKVSGEFLLADGGHPDIAGYQAMFGQIDLNIFNNPDDWNLQEIMKPRKL